MLPSNYIPFINHLKERIRSAQLQAQLALNKEVILLYCDIGKKILEEQEKQGWGSKVIDRLSLDLKESFPDFKGFSVRNLKYMRAFAEAYPDLHETITFSDLMMQRTVAQITGNNQDALIVQQLVAQIPWGHHIQMLTKLKKKDQRLYYMAKTIINRWNREELIFQIENKLHVREGNAITNFENTLTLPESHIAVNSFKNPYIFGLLNVSEEMRERELEEALVAHLKRFLLELGNGFSFVGNQQNLVVEGDDFFLDLLFYHIHLRRYVIFELKIGDFMPEFAGKLNFYINIVNEQYRTESDQPTIGILLCKTPNKTVVKYSLQNINQPMGVSEYFVNKLPKDFQGKLPTERELIEELDKEYELIHQAKENKEE